MILVLLIILAVFLLLGRAAERPASIDDTAADAAAHVTSGCGYVLVLMLAFSCLSHRE